MTDYSVLESALKNAGAQVYFCGLSTTGKYIRLVTDDTKETQKILMSVCRETAAKHEWPLDLKIKSTTRFKTLTIDGKTYSAVRNLLLPFKEVV